MDNLVDTLNKLDKENAAHVAELSQEEQAAYEASQKALEELESRPSPHVPPPPPSYYAEKAKQARSTSLHQNIRSVNDTIKKPYVAPLVSKAMPTTVLGRLPFPEHAPMLEHFLPQEEREKMVNPEPPASSENHLVINGYEDFIRVVRDNTSLAQEPEVAALIKTVDHISKACPCSRGTLRGSATGMYGQMLPIIQARNASFFDTIKKQQKVSTLTFKDGKTVLLEV